MGKINRQFLNSSLLIWRWYSEHYQLHLESEQKSVEHFLQVGYFNNLNPSPLVNTLWFKEYVLQNQGGGATNLLYDFVERYDINLHPLFTRSMYYNLNSQKIGKKTIENHFIEFGRFDKVNIVNCVQFDYSNSKLPNLDLIELIAISGNYFMDNVVNYRADTFNYRSIF